MYVCERFLGSGWEVDCGCCVVAQIKVHVIVVGCKLDLCDDP